MGVNIVNQLHQIKLSTCQHLHRACHISELFYRNSKMKQRTERWCTLPLHDYAL